MSYDCAKFSREPDFQIWLWGSFFLITFNLILAKSEWYQSTQYQSMKSVLAGQLQLIWLVVCLRAVLIGANDSHPIITPAEYLQLKEHVCNGSSLPEELSSRIENESQLAALKQTWFKDHGDWADHCLREPTAWRWSYVHELDQFQVLVADKSIDQRLANGIYTTTAAKIFDIDIFKYDSGSRQEDERNLQLVAGPQVNDELCGRHLRQMLELTRELEAFNDQQRSGGTRAGKPIEEKHLRLARVLDSFGRYDSGHLLGRFMSPGAYGQCLHGQLQLADHSETTLSLVRTRYCWARLSLDEHLDESLKLRNKSVFEIQQTSLLSGICIPESCHSKSFQRNRLLLEELVGSQFKLPKSMYVRETLSMESLFCLVDERGQFGMPLGGKVLLVALFVWTLAAISQTSRPKKPGSSQLLDCLDLSKSWKNFVGETENNVSTPKRFVRLDALNMLKCLLCMVVVFGHSLIITIGFSMDELAYLGKVEWDHFQHGMFATTMGVDTFFVITGILLGYMTMRALSNHQTDGKNNQGRCFKWREFFQQWLLFTLYRYLRMVPLLVLVYWFKRAVWIYLGSGPLWDFGFSRSTKNGACIREPWWIPLTFMSAYLPLSRQCLLQSWSISNDIFFSIFLPPILFLLHKRPRMGALMSFVAGSASIIASYEALGEMPTQVAWEMKQLTAYGILKLYNIASHLYTWPHLRISSVLIGIFAGYHLHHHSERAAKSTRPPKWPGWFTGTATFSACAFSVLMWAATFLCPYIKHYLSPYHRAILPHLLVTSRFLWATSNAVLFVRLTTSWKHSSFARMSSTRFWKIASQLNYAILLIHLDLLLFNVQISASTQVFSTWSFLWSAGASYLFCLPVALYLNIFIEKPVERLIKLVLFGDKINNNNNDKKLHKS